MNFALSPSAIKTFQKCPYQFYEKYISGTLPYVQSEAAARGDRLHKALEQYLTTDIFDWPEEKTRQTAWQYASTLKALERHGWELHIEQSVAMTRDGGACHYKAKPPISFLRCRIDAYAIHPERDDVIVVDWKTGKVWDLDEVQLVVNALCLRAVTGRHKFKLWFAYLDQDQIVDHSLVVPDCPFDEFPQFAPQLAPQFIALYWTIHNIAACEQEQNWPKRRNRFCKWCDVPVCMYH